MKTKKLALGKRKRYNIGTVVFWGGSKPCLGKINGRCSEFEDSYILNKESHNSCSVMNLRPATKEEINQLGDKDFLLIN